MRKAEGVHIDRTRSVELEGDLLAVRENTIDEQGTLGYTERLFYTSERRLMVHIANWSRQHGEMVIYSLLEVNRKDLQPGGLFAELASDAWAWLRT